MFSGHYRERETSKRTKNLLREAPASPATHRGECLSIGEISQNGGGGKETSENVAKKRRVKTEETLASRIAGRLRGMVARKKKKKRGRRYAH